jgi:hypothetical protein
MFAKTETGKFYGPKLAKKQAEVAALPEAIEGNRPYAEELAETDTRHDALGAAIFYHIEAIQRHPLLSDAVKQTALRLRLVFVPAISVLSAAYATEAQVAQANRPKLTELGTELKSFPVSGDPGATLYDWVSAFLDAGDEIGALLRKRAAAEAAAEGAEKAKAVRVATISLLGRCREALAEEIEENPELARNLDAIFFGYFDKLEQMRAESAAARAAARKARDGDAPAQASTAGETTGGGTPPGET